MRNNYIKHTAIFMSAALIFSTCFSANMINVTASVMAQEEISSGEATEDGETAQKEVAAEKNTEESDTGAAATEHITIEEAATDETTAEESSTEESAAEETTTEEITTEETTTEEITTEEITTEEITTEEVTTEQITEEPTTVDYEIIDGLYKVKQGVLIEYLGDKKDSSITALTIPASVTKIEKEVFLESIYIKEINFQSGSRLTEIGDYAFKDCSGLMLITLPQGLEKIGYRAFGNCLSLKEFTVPYTVTEGREIFGTKNSVTTVVFEEGMTQIPQEILQYAASVESVTVGLGVTVIGKHAFYHCTGLKSFTMPNTVTSIKASAFNGCSALAEVKSSVNLKSIGANAFKNCVGLKQLELNKTVTSIEDNAFLGDKSLVLLVFANSKAKAFARKNGISWDYSDSEKERRAANTAIWQNFMKLVSAKNKSRYPLKKLKNFVPQGTCVIGKYIVVSMYHKDLKQNSVLLLYNKSTGAYVKKVVLPSKDHVGAVTNIEGRLVVSLNNTASTDYVAVIEYSKLNKAKKGKKISYDYKVKLSGYADFSGYDGSIFWAGRSANTSNAKMDGYQVKIKNKKLTFKKKYSYVIPKNVQGVVIEKGKGSKRTFTFAQSYGRLNNSALITYSVKIKKASTLGSAGTTRTLPSMLEGISLYGKYIYMVFESGAGLYCADPDNTSEIQVKNVCKIKYTKLSKLS